MTDIPFETAVALSGLLHGFFGRRGGVSAPPFASLNVSLAGGDDPGRVAVNRARAAAAIGADPARLCTLKQVHSASVVTLDDVPPESIAADAMVTDRPGLVLGILTADCAPILLCDAEAGVIGAAHAGWRGARDGIVAATVGAMAALGAQPHRIVAAIGPAISQLHYEVGFDFADAVRAAHPSADRHLTVPAGGKPHFDLRGFVADQLAAAGIASHETVGPCTYGAPERYFSHRFATHAGSATGRQIALIALNAA